MNTPRSVQDWFQLIQTMDDTKLARELLGGLIAYGGKPYRSDIENLLALITAVRLDQMVKEAP